MMMMQPKKVVGLTLLPRSTSEPCDGNEVKQQSRKVIGRQGLVAGHAHDVRLGWAIERYWRAEDPNFLCLGPGPSLGGVPGKKRLMV